MKVTGFSHMNPNEIMRMKSMVSAVEVMTGRRINNPVRDMNALVSADGDSFEKSAQALNYENYQKEGCIIPHWNDLTQGSISIEEFDRRVRESGHKFFASDGRLIQIINPILSEDGNNAGWYGQSSWATILLQNRETAAQYTNSHYSGFIDTSSGVTVDDLRAMAASDDFTGMSDVEIFTKIHDRYAQSFGKNFLMAGAFSFAALDSDFVYHDILAQFHKDLISAFGSAERATQAARSAKFSDMSDSEVIEEIIARYPQGNQMTMRELNFLAWEMAQAGVDGGLHEMLLSLDGFSQPPFSNVTVDEFLIARESLLNQTVDVELLNNSFSDMYRQGVVSNEGMVLLQRLFGESFNPAINKSSAETRVGKERGFVDEHRKASDVANMSYKAHGHEVTAGNGKR